MFRLQATPVVTKDLKIKVCVWVGGGVGGGGVEGEEGGGEREREKESERVCWYAVTDSAPDVSNVSSNS